MIGENQLSLCLWNIHIFAMYHVHGGMWQRLCLYALQYTLFIQHIPLHQVILFVQYTLYIQHNYLYRFIRIATIETVLWIAPLHDRSYRAQKKAILRAEGGGGEDEDDSDAGLMFTPGLMADQL